MSKHPPARYAENKRLSRERARNGAAKEAEERAMRKALIEFDLALQGFWDKYKVNWHQPITFELEIDDPLLGVDLPS